MPIAKDNPQNNPQEEPALYVATSLAVWIPDSAILDMLAETITIGGVAFRRLTPLYHAWLSKKIAAAKAKGVLMASPKLARQWMAIDNWAVQRFGRAELDRAARNTEALRRYKPPKPFRFDEVRREWNAWLERKYSGGVLDYPA